MSEQAIPERATPQPGISPAAYALGGQPCTREAFYAAACDPQRHIVVQACAGAGKTWMLVSRIVRALLAGAQPQEILAITFTKKAAGEMRERLQEWLLAFSKASDEELAHELHIRGISSEIGSQANKDLRRLLSNLYQQSLANPRSVQIRTFHSWFAALLRHAPLGTLLLLGLPPVYELLEDDSLAIEALWPRFYALLQRDEALHRTYREAVADVGRWGVQEALTNALAKRVEFELADRAGVVARSIRTAAQVYPEFASVDDPLELLPASREVLVAAAKILSEATQKSYSAKGVELQDALAQSRWADVPLCLLTQAGQPRKFNDKLTALPDLAQAQALCMQVAAAQLQHAAWQHQQRMAQLSRALIACFADFKRERGWVDMGDLERAAHHVLGVEQISGWVQQRLDAQIRHLLIDEFQDTNPLQWQALQSWLSGYVGAGGGGASNGPSVFIVGDAKQSIYRFRRAEPQVFEAAARFVCEGLGGTLLACDHTRRNAQGITRVVNAIMRQAAAEQPYEFRSHTTESFDEGSVIRLPIVPMAEKAEQMTELIWRDTLTTPRDEIEEHTADTECQVAARWVAAQITGGMTLGLSGNQIMVLSRKRDRLTRMRDALRKLGVESQISEKIALCELPEVQDVVALLDALISPSNDLALARALKSPIFGWRDEDLAAIALAAREHRDQDLVREQQGMSWLDLLSKIEQTNMIPPRLNGDLTQKTARSLRQMQSWLAQLPPHDALSRIYEQHEVIARCMQAAPASLRPRVQRSLQALLHAALEVGSGRFLTPHALVRELKKPQLKAPQTAGAEQAVRLMTIHGAKGLEAHTVVMLDTCTPPAKASLLDVLVDWPGEKRAPQTFAFLRSEGAAPACVSAALGHELVQREREEINALYVAMTRARQQLVLSAHEVSRADAGSPWMRFEALAASDAEFARELHEPAIEDFALTGATQAHSTSFFIQKQPLVLINTAMNATELIVNSIPKATHDSAARIGIAMHRLLELYNSSTDLAQIAPSVGHAFQLDAAQSSQALQAALRIVQGEAAWLWDSVQIDWQASEVELWHGQQLLRLDRLVRHRASQVWWVIDYKSAAAPEHVQALCEQLGCYRLAVHAANPQAQVKAAFITAQGRMVEI
jgi:ATP-dependent helicase/nuclease subunit A